MVYYSFFGSNYLTILFKYIFQAIKTFTILLREKPDVIFVMNPPMFACIPSWVYCKVRNRTGYITDSHTAAFSMKRWQLLYPVQKFFFRNAITNIVTNRVHTNIIQKWGADSTIIGDIPVEFSNIKPYKNMKKGFNITLVNTFAPTEPLEVLLNAAEKIREVNFFITGDLKHADRDILAKCPQNVTFTGFLPDDQYAWLLKHSDVVMTQCTRDNTMQRGAYEAMSLGTPIITSDWDILRQTFSKGAVFVKAEVDSTIQGILKMKNNHERYEKEIIELRKERSAIWSKNKKFLLNKIKKYRDSC